VRATLTPLAARQRTADWLDRLDGHRLLGCRVPTCPELAAHEGLCGRCLHARLVNTRRELQTLRARHGQLLAAMRRVRALLRTRENLTDWRIAEPWWEALQAALERLDGIDPPTGGVS
jgi:hypothetical protein